MANQHPNVKQHTSGDHLDQHPAVKQHGSGSKLDQHPAVSQKTSGSKFDQHPAVRVANQNGSNVAQHPGVKADVKTAAKGGTPIMGHIKTKPGANPKAGNKFSADRIV